MAHTVFIDGEAGTTGLQIREWLGKRDDLEIVSIDPARRKDADARAELLNGCDVSILCLPDDASREAVSLVSNNSARIIDASTAHRIAPDWTYGFPELTPEQRGQVAKSSRISVPGCYPSGFLALVRPLVDAGILPKDWPVTVFGVSGYSGGGKALIERYENADHPEHIAFGHRLYGLSLKHKHLPEMQQYGALDRAPIFVPATGKFRQGMLVQLPLPLDTPPGKPSVSQLYEALAKHFESARFVTVVPPKEDAGRAEMFGEDLVGTNELRIHIFGNEAGTQALLVAELDNLGKGASGAAVQCLNLSLGLDEAAGLA